MFGAWTGCRGGSREGVGRGAILRLRSEDEFPAELQLPGVIGSITHRSKTRTEHVVVGDTEDGMVEDIERFGPEFEGPLSPEWERSDNRGIEVDPALCAQRVSARIAERVERRNF